MLQLEGTRKCTHAHTHTHRCAHTQVFHIMHFPTDFLKTLQKGLFFCRPSKSSTHSSRSGSQETLNGRRGGGKELAFAVTSCSFAYSTLRPFEQEDA